MTLLQRIAGLAQTIGSDIGYLISKILHRQNIIVTNLADGATVTHGLNSTKLLITFHNADGTPNDKIGWEIINATSIRIYLPIPDEGTATFTGEIFIIKRA